MRVVACLLALASSALAYSVTSPNEVQGWNNQGGQPLVWTRVATDPQNFTALLVNQQISGFSPQILAALVDGTLGKVNLNPPSGGWTVGSGFRVNLVVNDTQLNTILAQSPTFNITASTTTISTTGSTSSTGIVVTTTPATATTTADTTDNTDPIIVPTSNAAISGVALNGGLLGLISLLGFVLA